MLSLPPPVWALAYLLIAFGVSRVADWPLLPGWTAVPFTVGLISGGAGLAVSAAILFRQEGTEINPVSATNRKLDISGPFRFTRNPMYLGLVLFTLGIAVWVGRWQMLAAPVATFATANWAHIPFEEAKMRRQFGTEFEAYMREVRRWI